MRFDWLLALSVWFSLVSCIPSVLLAETAQAPTPLDEIPQAIEQAKEQYSPLTAEDIARRRQTVLTAMDQLEEFLSQADEATEAGWKRFLRWDELRRELAKTEEVDLDVLRAVLERLDSAEVGLELPPFTELRSALQSYLNALLVQALPDPEQTYRQALDELRRRVERYLAEPSTEAAAQIAEVLAFLQDIGQAPQIVAAIRRRFDEPNLRIAVSRELLATAIERDVDEPTEVNEVILGTVIRGAGRTRGRVYLALEPSDDRATLVLNLEAVARTHNVGVNGPVTIYSTGVTQIEAWQPVYINELGVFAGEAFATACARSNIYCIAAKLRIIEHFAWRQVRENQPQAEAIASRRAAARAREQFAEQIREQLEEANENFEEFLTQLTRRRLTPELLDFSTTLREMLITARYATERQLASPAPLPPEVGGDLSLRIHESAVGNISETLVGGRTFTPDEFLELAEDLPLQGEQQPEGLETDRDWSITFRPRHPVSAEFRDGLVILRVHLAQFTNEGDVVRSPMTAVATYRIESTPEGPKLVREERVEIEWPGRPPRFTQRVFFQEKFRDRFEALFRPELFVNDLRPEQAPEGFTALRDFVLRSQDNWFTAGFRLVPANER